MSNAIMNNIYNHYLTTYAPRSTTQYDTHKKSELRGIYNSIVKLNKESPWYLDINSAATQEYAISLKENARLLHNTIASLGGLDEERSLAQKAAYSTDPDSVSASYIGAAGEESDSAPQFEISVNALASPQENMGSYLPDEPVALAPDTYSFDVAINDLNYEFQFNINAGDTNRAVQERLVRLINNADIGIRAHVDAGSSRSSIRLTSTAMGLPEGRNSIFHISDDRTSKAAGVVDYLGLNYMSRQPSNSSFLLNGEEHSTSSNTFTIGQQFEVELKAVTPEDAPVTIGLKTDIESLTDNINSLIGGYNTFVSAANSYQESQTLSSRLSREMGAIAYRYTGGMADMGIRLQSDNTISIDEELLRETASGPGGPASYQALKGFAHALVQKTSQVSLNPMNYVNRTIVAYKNPGHNFPSPYATSAYSGMMFNSYC